jgi:DNA-binding XRE family transcriptional regulator
MSETIGDRLMDIRGGESLDTLSRRVGVKKNTYFEWEQGHGTPDCCELNLIHLFAHIQLISIEWIVTGVGEMYYTKPTVEKSKEEIQLSGDVAHLEAVNKIVGALGLYREGDEKKSYSDFIDVVETAAKVFFRGFHVRIKIKAI